MLRNLGRRLADRCVPNGQSFVGKALRWPLSVIPKDVHVSVVSGPNRGMRWIVGASVHGCWVGTYERPIADWLQAHLSEGQVFYDIGANVGYYTILASRAVGPSGRVIAFEPLPRNLRFLEQHVSLNQLRNVQIVPCAVVERGGLVYLDSEDSPSQARVVDEGVLPVSGIALDGAKLKPPDVIKMDVEGAEVAALRGAHDTLATARPRVVLSTHGESLRRACYAVLSDLGYRVRPLRLGTEDHIAEPSS